MRAQRAIGRSRVFVTVFPFGAIHMIPDEIPGLVFSRVHRLDKIASERDSLNGTIHEKIGK